MPVITAKLDLSSFFQCHLHYKALLSLSWHVHLQNESSSFIAKLWKILQLCPRDLPACASLWLLLCAEPRFDLISCIQRQRTQNIV